MECAEMKLLVLSGGIMLVFTFVMFYLFWPGKLWKAYNWYCRFRLGLALRYSYCGSYHFCYSSRGTPGGNTPSILLLHGFSNSKDMWMSVIKHIPRSQHVVCLDMPGHEGTSRTGVEDYSIHGQVRRVHQFVQSIGLDKRPFHLTGISMGGNVAGVYAAHYSSYLTSVTLICPAGLIYPKDTKFTRLLKGMEVEEPNPLIPSTLQEMKDMLAFICHNVPNISQQALQGVFDNRIPNNGFYKEVFMGMSGEKSRHSLQEYMHLITAPVQVIWGKEDQVLDVSGAAVLQATLPNCQMNLLDNGGHSLTIDLPGKIAKLIMDFISAQEVDAKKLS